MRYYVAFDTKDMQPNIVAVAVELKQEIVRDLTRGLPINLNEDPLYLHLHAYCMANPPKVKR